MNDYYALRSVLAGFAFSVIVVAAIGAAIVSGNGSILVPDPETVAEDFLVAMRAHRYEAALESFSRTTQKHIAADSLRTLELHWERSAGRADDVEATSVSEQKNEATVNVILETDRNKKVPLRVRLVKEDYLWKVEDLFQDSDFK